VKILNNITSYLKNVPQNMQQQNLVETNSREINNFSRHSFLSPNYKAFPGHCYPSNTSVPNTATTMPNIIIKPPMNESVAKII
jgi:hypothetical protein